MLTVLSYLIHPFPIFLFLLVIIGVVTDYFVCRNKEEE